MDTKKQITLILLVIYSQTKETKAVKVITRPVHEIINEPLRHEIEKPRQTPYGNPLAGNPQRARQHALNQQAMFNAERDRQHRAQLQRWTAQPPKMDSYMKAYHESHENHHLALENQQAKLQDNKNQASRTPIARTKGIKNEAVRNKQEKNRNHRSYGSEYYLTKSQNPRYYEGVTIKPNGNNGLTEAPTSLYTEAIPSTQFVYPKHYTQMQGFQSAHDIASLSSLLMKPANDQLSELNALIQSSDPNGDTTDIHKPIDLFFYLKDSPSHNLVEYDSKYAPQYAQAYSNEESEEPKDHKPITEEMNDIAEPNRQKVTSYGIQPVLTTAQVEIKPETTTTKSNNYYKLEVASQTISSAYKPKEKPQIEYILQEENRENEDQNARPDYQTLQYGQQYYYTDEKDANDGPEAYFHHDADHKGIQHLTEDGTGISAYSENNENIHYAANYEFGYRVRDQDSGNYFGHHEAKSGENTSGHYHVLLPDGRMQKVKYYAGPSGFHADISYAHLQDKK